ncbi:hypothetical protein CCY16_00876, partial [Wolbachia endosymbiont of Wuchereria bancrofti]
MSPLYLRSHSLSKLNSSLFAVNNNQNIEPRSDISTGLFKLKNSVYLPTFTMGSYLSNNKILPLYCQNHGHNNMQYYNYCNM